ncbi:venom allergen 3-like isoform X2 [Aricia agestis]|uniref:venom allergen 3-like isoform X2 n=1 Tax=Aricia agestis TaxID=91739 RepID=UPI001C207F29|nr:venom allergen 3-like isoform X2 [Aricia agestis]
MFIKFFVLVFCFCEVNLQNVNYCELCANHTLCKYKNPGPSNSCLGYDKNGDLTEQDIRDILKRINYRRNYVALQNMKRLPGAANMRKMKWSSELALIAQRWADQCDPNTFPDRSDECRDTGDYRVGQNIATITGLSTGINVKTFIDIWFIESLEYAGTVLYYDQSRENKTNYFTQLIWAETDKVGCGRVRFYNDDSQLKIM